MVSSTLIYFNKNQEEVARVMFDENDCAVWLREFDPETGKLRAKSQRKELASATTHPD